MLIPPVTMLNTTLVPIEPTFNNPLLTFISLVPPIVVDIPTSTVTLKALYIEGPAYEYFRRHNPPSFEGSYDLTNAKDWQRKI